MINFSDPEHVSEAIRQTEEYNFRKENYLPYPDIEVEKAVRDLAVCMELKPLPRIKWLGKSSKKELKCSPRIDETTLIQRTYNYFRAFKKIRNKLWTLNNNLYSMYESYYSEEPLPKELIEVIRRENRYSPGERRYTRMINSSGIIREKVKRLAGPLPPHPFHNGIPNRFYHASASLILDLRRFRRAYILGENIADKQKKEHRLLEACKKISVSLYSIIAQNSALILIERPKIYENGRGLHRENGPAIEFPKLKIGIYARNDVRVTKELVMTPADKLKADMITLTRNAEVRREIVDKIGINRILRELKSVIIDKTSDEVYQLLNLDLGDTGRQRPFLKMLNPSTGDWHIEGVPPGIQTVQQAIKWRNGEVEPPQVLT